MAITELYVDPSIAADSGAGTVGDPYGDLEYAIEQETFDTTNGTRINVKAGTDEILAADLATALADTSVSIAWAPTSAIPLIIQGYTSTAGDGGIGGVDGNAGNFSVIGGSALDGVALIDMHLHNTGSATVVDMDNTCAVIRCEIDTATGGGLNLDDQAYVSGCYLHNVGGIALRVGAYGVVCHNYIDVNGVASTNGLFSASYAEFFRNIVIMSTTGNGINVTTNCHARNNSVFAVAGTGTGILVGGGVRSITIMNNIVEGFSGAGGAGFDLSAANISIYSYKGNASYNNTTHYAAVSDWSFETTDNEILTASGFTSAATGDFSPVDTGNVKEGALPQVFGQPAQ